MKLSTKRLDLIPLTAEQLYSLIYNLNHLEKNLEVTYKAEPVSGFFMDILKEQLRITENDPKNYVWHSFWLIIRKSDRIVVGLADFKDVPDSEKKVEIGYGLGKDFEGMGYMTEAISLMCRWALSQEGVSNIIAETDLDGISSQSILLNLGFKEISRGETLWFML